MNSKQKGNIGIGAAISYYTRKGVNVCLPLTDSQSYDLVIDDGSLKRVQVKYTSQKVNSGNYIVELRSISGSSRKVYKTLNENTADILVVVTSEYILEIPVTEIKVQQLTLTQDIINKWGVAQ